MSENTNNEETTVEPTNDVVEDKIETVEEIKETPKPEAKPEEPVISAPVVEDDKPGLGYLQGGVMGSTTVPKNFAKKPANTVKSSKQKDTVAVHSTRNVTWPGVGKVYNGYNIVTKDAADKWVTRDHIRLATPQEVAQEFGL